MRSAGCLRGLRVYGVPVQGLLVRCCASPFAYEGVGKELVHALKYGGYLPVVEKVMAPLMAGSLDGGRFDAVIPVPLHRSRLAKRGFNQTELMARRVAERINAPLLDKLKAVRRTRDQVELFAG